MPDSENNCPSCADKSGSVFGPLPNNPNVSVQPWAPPTANELAFSRQYYADRNGGTVTRPDETALIQAQLYAPVAPFLEQRVTVAAADGVTSSALRHLMSGEDILMPSQLIAPWFQAAPSAGSESAQAEAEDRGEDHARDPNDIANLKVEGGETKEGPFGDRSKTSRFPDPEDEDEDDDYSPKPTAGPRIVTSEGVLKEWEDTDKLPEKLTNISCPNKGMEYAVFLTWQVEEVVALAQNLDDAEKASGAAMKLRTANKAISDADLDKEVAGFVTGLGVLKCSDPCRIHIEVTSYYHHVWVGTMFVLVAVKTNGSTEDVGYQVLVRWVHSVWATLLVTCMK